MYNQAYYNPQVSLDRINSQIVELERMREQIQKPPQAPTNLTQNFQLAPTNRDVIKYAGSINEVQRDMVIGDTPYFSKDMSVVWVKNTKGEIKTYELNEIVPKDEKDLKIELLLSEISELKGMINNERVNTDVNKEQVSEDTTTMMGQLEQQLKRINPQAYQKYQQARESNNPDDLLNETINGFNSNQRQEWDSIMGMFNQKK